MILPSSLPNSNFRSAKINPAASAMRAILLYILIDVSDNQSNSPSVTRFCSIAAVLSIGMSWIDFVVGSKIGSTSFAASLVSVSFGSLTSPLFHLPTRLP
jgi:hypothetical protein